MTEMQKIPALSSRDFACRASGRICEFTGVDHADAGEGVLRKSCDRRSSFEKLGFCRGQLDLVVVQIFDRLFRCIGIFYTDLQFRINDFLLCCHSDGLLF